MRFRQVFFGFVLMTARGNNVFTKTLELKYNIIWCFMGTPNIKRETDMYKKVSTDLDFCSREQEVIEFWKDNDVFKASCAKNAGKAEFSF